ncbi:MAG: 3-methylcrotonyl-CoA carboxylase subunit alpha [marine bacterium B5-7]|nr:MAG: 3-methylcrotonyl-CoA carboxylase subunit alpha [marine bacterium B5-7]
MFDKILIANRGEIACRVIRSARQLGVATVAVYSDADRDALHVHLADEAVRIGPAEATQSYLDIDRIINAATMTGAEAIHPGYGFLSENPKLVEACQAANIVFIGPPADAIRAMGLKDAAKALMHEAGVPIVPGYHGDQQEESFLAERAGEIGYPVLIKARAGGGGKGMRRVESSKDFGAALDSARREATAAFGDDQVLVEKYVDHPRHIEVQVFADNHGEAVYLFERDCSLQRRHQKIIEEAPAPGMPENMRRAMGESAVRAAKAVGYSGAGTVEFIVDASHGLNPDRYYFMEMNTRLQVEHPVTEAITGHDLVAWQLRVAAGQPLPVKQEELSINGHAFEARVYAEDPDRGFLPATGTLTYLNLPEEVARVDSGVRMDDVISPYYDPMLAKIIVHGADRATALNRLSLALKACHIAGCKTNVGFLTRLARLPAMVSADVDTHLVEKHIDELIQSDEPPFEAIIIGALCASGFAVKPSGSEPFDTLIGWRHFASARHYVHLSRGDKTWQLELVSDIEGSVKLWLDDREVSARVTRADANRIRVIIDDRQLTTGLYLDITSVTLFIDGETWRFELPDHLSGEGDSEAAEDIVRAPMPGRIITLKVAVGDHVTTGDTLAVIEAMKMEHALKATRDGTIEGVSVATGDQVEEGAIIISLAKESG